MDNNDGNFVSNEDEGESANGIGLELWHVEPETFIPLKYFFQANLIVLRLTIFPQSVVQAR